MREHRQAAPCRDLLIQALPESNAKAPRKTSAVECGQIEVMATVPRGGSWLFEDTPPGGMFSPERLSDEQRLMAKTADEFISAEVMPVLDRLESKDWQLCRALVKRCGDLGLLGIAAPEAYGGLDLDKASSLVVVERIARSASFGTTFGGQVNLCILPLVLFGTPEQKTRYLPRLIAGDVIGAYALSDAGGGQTKVDYRLAVDLKIPMIGLIRRKAEKVIIDTALKELKKRVRGVLGSILDTVLCP